MPYDMESTPQQEDSYLQSDIEKIKKIQRKPALFINGDYITRTPESTIYMLKTFYPPPLEVQRNELCLTFLLKMVEG